MTDSPIFADNPALPVHLDEKTVLQGLLEISNFVGSVMLLEDILNRIVGITSDLMQVPICSIYMLDADRRHITLRSNIGFEPELRGKAQFDVGEGIPGWVIREGQMVVLADATLDPRYRPLPSALELDCHAYMCVPLRIQEEIVGVMTVRKRIVYHFQTEEILLFETIGKQAAIVIEKSRMYEEKIQAERLAAVAVSLSGVAHYIKNVLLTMQGGEYLVNQGLEESDLQRTREGWEVLRRSNRKIRSLVENILNYCRKEEIELRPVPLNRMILELLRSLEGAALERGVILQADLDESLGEVMIDADGMHDALLNLVTNGMDAITEGQTGRVRISTRRFEDRNQALIEVVDSGSGIPEEHRDKIFNLFFSTKGKKGTGIGLAATRKIIEEHGGTIELNHMDGQGAHFMIYLPIQAPAA